MRTAFSKLLLILLVGEVFFGLSAAQAGPFDFLRRIRDSIAHTRHHQRTPPTTPSKRDSSTTVKRNDFRPPELKEPEESPGPVTTRTASSVAPPQQPRTDLPYGVSVPNKPGFVISPYSPNAGYVDIRGFPSGTEVKVLIPAKCSSRLKWKRGAEGKNRDQRSEDRGVENDEARMTNDERMTKE